MTPPWYRVAAKALTALAVAIVVASGTVLAALADDHVNSTEAFTIVLAILGALVGPGAVYATHNARTLGQALTDVEEAVGEPVAVHKVNALGEPVARPDHFGHSTPARGLPIDRDSRPWDNPA